MTLQEWGSVASLATTCVATISVCVALAVFIYTRRVNRKRATLDMIMKTFLDKEGSILYDGFKKIIRQDQDKSTPFDLKSLAVFTVDNEHDRNTVLDQLNSYELISLGIRKGLFDEDFYKLWFHKQFTKDFASVQSLILEIQKERPSIYCEYVALYRKWDKIRHPVNHPGKIKMLFWIATNQFDKLDSARKGMKA